MNKNPMYEEEYDEFAPKHKCQFCESTDIEFGNCRCGIKCMAYCRSCKKHEAVTIPHNLEKAKKFWAGELAPENNPPKKRYDSNEEIVKDLLKNAIDSWDEQIEAEFYKLNYDK